MVEQSRHSKTLITDSNRFFRCDYIRQLWVEIFVLNMCCLPASIPTVFTLTCLLFSAVEFVGPMGRESCSGIWKEAEHIYVVQ